VLCCLEYFMKLSDPGEGTVGGGVTFLIGEIPVYRRLEFLKKLFSYAIQGFIILSDVLFFDEKQFRLQLLIEIHHQQRLIIQYLRSKPWLKQGTDNKQDSSAKAKKSKQKQSSSADPVVAADAGATAAGTEVNEADIDGFGGMFDGDEDETVARGLDRFRPKMKMPPGWRKREWNEIKKHQDNKQTNIPWGLIIFLVIALLNYFK